MYSHSSHRHFCNSDQVFLFPMILDFKFSFSQIDYQPKLDKASLLFSPQLASCFSQGHLCKSKCNRLDVPVAFSMILRLEFSFFKVDCHPSLDCHPRVFVQKLISETRTEIELRSPVPLSIQISISNQYHKVLKAPGIFACIPKGSILKVETRYNF